MNEAWLFSVAVSDTYRIYLSTAVRLSKLRSPLKSLILEIKLAFIRVPLSPCYPWKGSHGPGGTLDDSLLVAVVLLLLSGVPLSVLNNLTGWGGLSRHFLL